MWLIFSPSFIISLDIHRCNTATAAYAAANQLKANYRVELILHQLIVYIKTAYTGEWQQQCSGTHTGSRQGQQCTASSGGGARRSPPVPLPVHNTSPPSPFCMLQY
jgi:hypothetical protein